MLMTLREMLDQEGIKCRDAGCGDGWVPLIQNLISNLKMVGWEGQVSTIKEKFGGLRFYASVNQDQNELIRKAEAKSRITCEYCGAPGDTRCWSETWLKTLCMDCGKQLRIKLGLNPDEIPERCFN